MYILISKFRRQVGHWPVSSLTFNLLNRSSNHQSNTLMSSHMICLFTVGARPSNNCRALRNICPPSGHSPYTCSHACKVKKNPLWRRHPVQNQIDIRAGGAGQDNPKVLQVPAHFFSRRVILREHCFYYDLPILFLDFQTVSKEGTHVDDRCTGEVLIF
jgi:hypothetical protein